MRDPEATAPQIAPRAPASEFRLKIRGESGEFRKLGPMLKESFEGEIGCILGGQRSPPLPIFLETPRKCSKTMKHSAYHFGSGMSL